MAYYLFFQEDLVRALKQSGVFYLRSHGVSEVVVADMFSASGRFFRLSEDTKRSVLGTPETAGKGYTPVGEERLDASAQPDAKEGYYLAREPEGFEEGRRFMSQNVWPSEGVVPGFRCAMETYLKEMTAAGRRVVRAIAEAMGVSDLSGFLRSFAHPVATVRPLYYPPVVSVPGEGRYGAGAHTDYGMITLLAVFGGAAGLEVFCDGVWCAVPPAPKGCFIVNAGDVLARMSNDVFVSPRHRVVNHRGLERFSTAFFFDPNVAATVECLPQFCQDRAPRYPPVLYGDHLLERFNEAHGHQEGGAKL